MGKINDKYVIRMPAVIMPDGHEVIPHSINTKGLADMGSLTWLSTTTLKGAKTIVEGSVISGNVFVGRGREWPPKIGDTSEDEDLVVGRGLDWPPHKHDYEEIFVFWGTNPDNIMDLGADVEFWLGEDDELEKIEFSSSVCIYVPVGMAHFPMRVTNCTRPFIITVIMPNTTKRFLKPASFKGRPVRKA
jgi:hypothetical protein